MSKTVFKGIELTELIAVYVSAVVHYALVVSSAKALQRELDDTEIRQIMDEIEAASDAFVTAHQKKLVRSGNTLRRSAQDALRAQLNEQIMDDCRALMQKVSEEITNITV